MPEKKSKADKEAQALKDEKVGEGADFPETPSGQALAKAGPDGDGEEYAKEKSKARWGY